MAFGGYALFGGLRLFRAGRTLADLPPDPEATTPFNRRQWITLGVIGALIVSVLTVGVHVGMAAFFAAVRARARRRRRRRRGDSASCRGGSSSWCAA